MDFYDEIKPFIFAIIAIIIFIILFVCLLITLTWAGSFIAYQEKLAQEYFKTEQTPTEKEEQ